MMHEDVDNDEEEVILDRRTLIHQPNNSNSLSNSGPILLGVNRFNIKVYDDPIKLSRAKTILLAVTCISIGMFTGLLGPTFQFLSQHMSSELSAVTWLISMKAIGFLIGSFLSAYLYAWFNVCCLLGLSCLAISFGVCSLPLITDLATFYLTSLILGIGLGISYNGIDALYNRLWTRSSLVSIRWLHLLVAFGALLSTSMLFPSNISIKNDISSATTMTPSFRPRREITNEVADLLAAMSPPANEDMLFNATNAFNLSNDTYTTSESFSIGTSTTTKLILKPSVVETDALKQSLVAKPIPGTDQSNVKLPCMKLYCCYNYNNINQNETIRNNPFTCQENNDNPSDDCKNIFSLCKNSTSQICLVDKTNVSCRIDPICENEQKSDCSIQSINAAINASSSTIATTVIPTSTIITTTILSTTTPNVPIESTTLSPSTSTSTSTSTPTTTITTTTVATTTAILETTSKNTISSTSITTHRNKPSMAESHKDDLSKNLFFVKIHLFFNSITSINLIYLLIALLFFLLGIIYSTLAMRGEGINTSSTKSINLNPLSLLFGNSHRTINNSNKSISLLSDSSSLKFVLLLIVFYFIMIGIESSCIYLTYLFGIELKFQSYQCLIIQFLFIFGLVLGRLIDILMNYGCFLFNTRITNRTKKQSDKFHLISIKFCILIRLILLLLICSTLSFSHLFQDNSTTTSSIPSIRMFYFIFLFIGLLIASLPTLILYWIERDLSLNDSLKRFILITITISEIIVPSFLFYTIKHVVLSYVFYLFIGSCLLLILFMFILYTSKKWQRKQLYRILPTSMEMDEINIENHSDDDNNDEYYLNNGRMNFNETKINLDNERIKGLKGH
ncbi:unnamed protein product [Rotaria sordida]|uniref:Uncharacterized protein n=2 Tax=Rotaria sordida TaxID=392033 RepID=A0A814LLL0_9BILA|nr:unnamed protein product [Rotaria sordida]